MKMKDVGSALFVVAMLAFIGATVSWANAVPSRPSVAAPVPTPVVGYANNAVIKLNSWQTAMTLVYLNPLRYCTVILAEGSQQGSAVSCVLAPTQGEQK